MGEVMEERRIYQEAEWNVLGALIVDADYCAAEILLEVSPADFIHTECREIFKAAAALYAGDIPISRLSLAAKLPGEYADMLTQLEQITPTATLFRASVAALKREARRNRAFTAAQEIADKLRYGEDPDRLQEEAEQLLGTLGNTSLARESSLDDMLLEFYSDAGTEKNYFDWGFDSFNRMLMCEGGEYVILAARPSVGKTALALQLATHFSKRHRVAFYSLETSRKKVTQRIMAAQAMVDFGKIRRGKLDERDMRALLKVKDKLLHLPYMFVDAAGWTAGQICSHAVRKGIKIAFIDYLQLVSHSNVKINETEYSRVTEVSRSLQGLSQKSVTVIALSQFSRIGDPNDPKLSDLRSSGQIEQDADVIAFLYRPAQSELTAGQLNDYEKLRVMEIAKNRDGELGRIPMWFQGKYQHFMQEWDHFYDTATTDMPPDPPPEQMKLGGSAV